MITLCRTLVDTNGSIDFYELPSTDFGEIAARVSRQATLDGGAVITHYGVSHADRTFRIEARVNSTQKTALEYLHFLNEDLILGCSEGLFLGAISTMSTAVTPFTMTFLVKEKLA